MTVGNEDIHAYEEPLSNGEDFYDSQWQDAEELGAAEVIEGNAVHHAAAAAAAAAAGAQRANTGGGRRRKQKNWHNAETRAAFRAGTRGSLFKQQNKTGSMQKHANELFAQFVMEEEANGTWTAPMSAEDSIKERCANLPNGKPADHVWNRWKACIKVSGMQIQKLYQHVCPGGAIPSGRDADWVMREITVAYHALYKLKDENLVGDAAHEACPPAWSDGFLDVWREYGPLGENVPMLSSAECSNRQQTKGNDKRKYSYSEIMLGLRALSRYGSCLVSGKRRSGRVKFEV